jgi:restriction system protein
VPSVVDGTLWALHHSGGLSLVEMNMVRIGWVDAGDLTDLPDDRETFKAHLRTTFPDRSEGWVANAAGQLLRFRHSMQVGELIAYPQKSDRTINIGRITGEYVYDQATSARYPHSRTVDWIQAGIPREAFSQGCLYELGAAMSVFTIKTHREEILAKVGTTEATDGPVPPESEESSPEVDEPTAERINESTRDYILKTFNSDLKGHGFAQWCGWLLETLGYTAQVSPPGADGGVDIVATEDPLGVKRPLLKVQCKSGTGAIGSEEVQALNGTLAENELGLFIALGGFTKPAKHVASGMPKMRLLESEELVDLILDHYPDLGDEAKEALRLRRVWVPDRPAVDE